MYHRLASNWRCCIMKKSLNWCTYSGWLEVIICLRQNNNYFFYTDLCSLNNISSKHVASFLQVLLKLFNIDIQWTFHWCYASLSIELSSMLINSKLLATLSTQRHHLAISTFLFYLIVIYNDRYRKLIPYLVNN